MKPADMNKELALIEAQFAGLNSAQRLEALAIIRGMQFPVRTRDDMVKEIDGVIAVLESRCNSDVAQAMAWATHSAWHSVMELSDADFMRADRLFAIMR